ncbi:response regulator [Trichothermofontia sp.]
MKILIVEDDISIAKTLQLLFSTCNYAVDLAFDGDTGLQMADIYEYDLFLLDVLLPKLDGISLCKYLRSKGCQSPILLLTGQDGAKEKAIALNTGADDYVVKPFDPEELIARVQALLRRSGPTNQAILSWGQLSVDPVARTVAYKTRLLLVSPKEYAILEVLLRKPQQVLSASAILDHAWTSLDAPGEDVVRSHIKELRRKLTAAGAPKDFIKTVYKVGYRLNPLYSSPVVPKLREHLTPPQVAELNAVNEELRSLLEQLRSTQAELQQKHQELEAAYQTIAQERQQLQAARDELEQRVAERTAELMATNQALQERQEQWQALFDHALDAIVITDARGNYVDINPAACDLLDIPRTQILPTHIVQASALGTHEEDLWQVLSQQGEVSGEFYVYRQDGIILEVEVNAIANFIPGLNLAIMRDISERKLREIERHQATLALRESERKLATVIKNLPGYVYRVANDLNYTPEFISEGVVNITGYHQADYLIYRTISHGKEIHPDDVELVWDCIQQKIVDHQPYECEYRIITRSGTLKWVWERGQGIYDDTGKLLYLEGQKC